MGQPSLLETVLDGHLVRRLTAGVTIILQSSMEPIPFSFGGARRW